MMIRRPIPEPLRRLSARPRPEELLDAVRCATETELQALCRLYLLEGVPVVFDACPIEYENVRLGIAVGLGIEPGAVRLIGSARVGYSLNPKRFSRAFSADSRLDFAVVDAVVFAECVRDAVQWRDDVEGGRRLPRTDGERRYWHETFAALGTMASRGHLDPKVIFEHEDYRRISEIRNTMRRAWRELTYLERQYKLSVRVYRDWDSFYCHQIARLRQLRKPTPGPPALPSESA